MMMRMTSINAEVVEKPTGSVASRQAKKTKPLS